MGPRNDAQDVLVSALSHGRDGFSRQHIYVSKHYFTFVGKFKEGVLLKPKISFLLEEWPMQSKKPNPSKKRIKLLTLILLTFIAWSGITLYNQWIDIKQIKDKINELRKEEEKVLGSKKNLEEKILLLQDDNYVGDMARKYYFLSKPGEYIFITSEE